MLRRTVTDVVLAVAAVALGATYLTSAAAAQTAPARAMPVFELDRAWPKVPSQWKLGDASSIGVDAQDNIWLLQRPRTLKPEDAAKMAPPILVFDQAGNFIKAWGGTGSGFEWPEREHGIHLDHKGHVWIGGNNFYVGGGTDIVVVDRKTLEILGSIELPGMAGGGHQIGTDAKGHLYVAAINRGAQKLTFKGLSR